MNDDKKDRLDPRKAGLAQKDLKPEDARRVIDNPPRIPTVIYLRPVGKANQVTLTRRDIGIVLVLAKNFTNNPQQAIQDLASILSTNIPGAFARDFTPAQIQSLTKPVAAQVLGHATKLANQITQSGIEPDKLQSLTLHSPNSVWVLKKLAELEPSSGFPETAIAEATIQDTVGPWVQKIYGKTIKESLLGSPEQQDYELQGTPTQDSIAINLEQSREIAFETAERMEEERQESKSGKIDLSDLLNRLDTKKLGNKFPARKIFEGARSLLSEIFPSETIASTAAVVGVTTTDVGLGLGEYGIYRLVAPQLFTAWRAQSFMAGRLTFMELPTYQRLLSSMGSAEQSLRLYSQGLVSGGFSPSFIAPAESLSAVSPIVAGTTAEGVVLEAPALVAATEGGAAVTAGVAGTAGVEAAAGVVATGAATTTTTAGIGAAISALLTPIGGVITAAIVAVAQKLVDWFKTKIWPWIKKNLDKIGAGLIGTGVLLFMLGRPGIGIPLVILGGGATFAGGVGIATSSAALAWLILKFFWRNAATDSLKIVAITLVTLPIIVVLIIFIINTGAYVVPPSDKIADSGARNPGALATATCPLRGDTTISTSSYDATREQGHGSNGYWSGYSDKCSFPLPTLEMFGLGATGCLAPDPNEVSGSEDNVCVSETSSDQRCEYYGYAVDVEPEDGVSYPEVELPLMCGSSDNCSQLNWTLVASWYNCSGASVGSPSECVDADGNRAIGWGYGYVFEATGNGHTWKIYLNHIDPTAVFRVGDTFVSGTSIGTISHEVGTPTDPTSHVHIELNIDGVPVRPDFMCGSGQYLPGGVAGICPAGGEEITEDLASRIPSGGVRFLPNTVPPRSDANRLCIEPTMFVMHWSAGANDNPSGNEATYNTLVNRGLACQVGTDTNDVEFWQPFYEDQVEMAWCANSWNSYAISVEMAGVSFTGNPPPPNLNELNLTLDATCEVMRQYEIPWCEIYGHYEVPDSGGKTDPGSEFLPYFVDQIKAACPNDPLNVCGGGASGGTDALCRGSMQSIDAGTRQAMAGVTMRPGCPVGYDDLRELTVPYYDFGGSLKEGKLQVHKDVAVSTLDVFEDLCNARFPISKMEPLHNPAYGGDDVRSMEANNTSGFNCRQTTGSSSWSMHAYGKAIDINPVQNPYVSGSTVLPSSGAQYVNRNQNLPGMIKAGDIVVRAFQSIGWRWGGNWSNPKDYQHFSANGN